MSFGSLQISTLNIEPNLVLAPMSGITGSAFRRLIKRENRGAVGLVYSEFVSVEGLTRGNKRSAQMCCFLPEERPIVIQLFGFDVSRMVEAAQIAEAQGADIVDINCGCPVPKVVKRGGGCELMRRTDHLERMLSAVAKQLRIPLTIKIRAGWDDATKNAPEVARMAEDSGVSAIAIHARTAKQGYQGQVDWRVVQQVCSAVQVPVIASGDIDGPGAARTAWDCGVSALMIGRPAMKYPWVFADIAGAEKGFSCPVRGEQEIWQVIQDYLAFLAQELPEKAILGRAKQLVLQITKKIAGSSDIRRAFCLTKCLDEFSAVLASYKGGLLEQRG